MNVLLDTHVLIWWDEGSPLSRRGRAAILDADQVFVSAASAWEVAIKAALGKLRSTRTVAQAAGEAGFTELPILFRHAEQVARLTPHHRDPFDRMLVAQALDEGLTLVTRDPVFRAYRIPTIKA